MLLTLDHGPIREVRLNRPPANALTLELMVALREAIETAPQNGSRALVLSGSPGRFSGGLDVPVLLGYNHAAIGKLWHEFYALLKTLAASPIPVAAAITGHAPAGGTVLAMFCDERLMAEGDFKIGLNEVQVGLILPPVILFALQRLVGPRQAERLAVSGMLISPPEALAVGLVDQLTTSDQVIERAILWCQGVLALPDEAMSATRKLARSDLVDYFERNTERELQAVAESCWSPQTQGALRALTAKLGKKVTTA
ncbi:MAG: enoyl-CoA hydratase/isomerase family protein [Acidobacteria bacterium]|nr:MAG: enoyl-CoA hydratase/isomerase family protein [Acidobacteriota bacterium]